MNVSYNKLFKLLIDRGMKKKDLQKKAGISSASVSKLAKNECVRKFVCRLMLILATLWKS